MGIVGVDIEYQEISERLISQYVEINGKIIEFWTIEELSEFVKTL